MAHVQSAQDVVEGLPPELVGRLADVALQGDDAIIGALEGHFPEFGFRGFCLNTGILEARSRHCDGSVKLRPFGRQVAAACLDLRDREGSLIPDDALLH